MSQTTPGNQRAQEPQDQSAPTPVAATPAEQPPPPRPARSKNGCNACRRRKVRCNERRPRCGHCERLNLDCTWNRPIAVRNSSFLSYQSQTNTQVAAGRQTAIPTPSQQNFPPFDGFNHAFFDYSVGVGTWDEAMLLSPNSWPLDPTMTGPHRQMEDMSQQPIHGNTPLGQPFSTLHFECTSNQHQDTNSTSPFSTEEHSNISGDDEYLVNSFLSLLMPPILTPVETGPKWASTRAFFGSMAAESTMVRSAIKTFAAMQMQRSGIRHELKRDWRPFYDVASSLLSSAIKRWRAEDAHGASLKYILASIFLLTYTDLLTETLPRAHSNLREAYALIQSAPKSNLSAAERRLISWLRLLDARAVSTAGGEGLFLADPDETLFDASPTPNLATSEEAEVVNTDTEIEEILFDVLYQPGITFYHEVQSFVGRITRIDLWHRSRGTVKDETEVMALAAQISKDLHALYDQRPALMDHAVAGNLTEKHLAKPLASAITRSFRSYLANYYASFLHLHRVAYVNFSRTPDVYNAIGNIKKLAHLMAQTDESLPVNLLWPLLMWGCEEDNLEDRRWIIESIRSLETIATNAKVTADLLEEVQRRQDEGKRRMDVRGVSQECFASHHFAIV